MDEYNILKYINENEDIDQRNIIKSLDISARNVNSKTKENTNKVKYAVILAAGEKKIFGKPISFLELEDGHIIDRTVNILNNNGIEKIVIVTGYKSEYFEKY